MLTLEQRYPNVVKQLQVLGWKELSPGLWTTTKRGLKRHTASGLSLREAASIESIKFSDFDDPIVNNETMSNGIVYNVFDAMPLDCWLAQRCDMPYHERSNLVHDTVSSIQNVRLSPVYQVSFLMARNEKELKDYFQTCMDNGFEGVMLKTVDTPYVFKRSENILKLKPCVTYEGVIVDHYEGRRGTKREGLFGGFSIVLPNGVVTRLGGGYSDALKADIQLHGPDTYLGKIVEIEAQPDPLTPDGLTSDGKARFPVFMRFRSESDVDPKVIAAGTAWFEDASHDAKEIAQ